MHFMVFEDLFLSGIWRIGLSGHRPYIITFTPIPFFIFFNTLSILYLYILYDHSLKVAADLSA